MDLLRFTTAGSVDDGKSTLIGRLLYDTKSIFQDQLEAIEHASRRSGEAGVNLALLTDGLRAEREQKITIDVAYRYFATPKRKFIIADTPGHIQYTRNMVTGASTAELAIVLIDARRGVLTQSKRHGFIASLLRIPHILVAVNKMDLVDFDRATYERIVAEYSEFAEKLDVKDLIFVPISALDGDNVVTKSERTPWYDGATLLHALETVNVGASRNLLDFRLPVQYVIRPHQDYRGFAGRIASGTVAAGEDVVVLPSGQASRIRTVETADGPLAEATAPDSVVVTLDDEIDVSRGDMIVRKLNLPIVADRLEAMVCWMSDSPLRPGARYVLMQTTRTVQARVEALVYRIDVDTLHRQDATELGLNDIGRVRIRTGQPIFFDPYGVNRDTGGFILIDPHTNVTVGAGMIRGDVRGLPEAEAKAEAEAEAVEAGRRASPNVVWEAWNLPRAEREAKQGHLAAALWLTGLSGSGKSTIARALERRLFERGVRTMLLEGDQVRHGLCGDLGFDAADRTENIRRVGEVARLFFEQGSVVICAFVSPFQAARARARALFPEGRFIEVHVDCALDECRRRDPKGLYAKAEAGELDEMTGLSSPYEAPVEPELTLRTDQEDVDACVRRLIEVLEARGILPRA
ncbi:MAG: sulfate adenylyltransferase subunit CysN [Longimicrobiales bacterium]